MEQTLGTLTYSNTYSNNPSAQMLAGLLRGLHERIRVNDARFRTVEDLASDKDGREFFLRQHSCMNPEQPDTGLRLTTSYALSLSGVDSPMLIALPEEEKITFLNETLENLHSRFSELFPELEADPAEFDVAHPDNWGKVELFILIRQALLLLNGAAFECQVLAGDPARIDLVLQPDIGCYELYQFEEGDTLSCFWARIELTFT